MKARRNSATSKNVHEIDSSNITMHVDKDSGLQFSHNKITGETLWLGDQQQRHETNWSNQKEKQETMRNVPSKSTNNKQTTIRSRRTSLLKRTRRNDIPPSPLHPPLQPPFHVHPPTHNQCQLPACLCSRKKNYWPKQVIRENFTKSRYQRELTKSSHKRKLY